MEMTAKEVHSVSHNNRDIKSTGVSFGCTWNSRGWQAKDGVVFCHSPEDFENNIYCKKKNLLQGLSNKSLKTLTN